MNFTQTLSAIFESDSQQNLNPKLWENENLRPKISDKLSKIATDFANGYNIPTDAIQDIIITGSLANYTWTEFSDIDLHLVVDLNEIHSDTDLVKEYYKLAKSIWNSDHSIHLCGYEVEIYVQDATEEHYSTGVYSLQTKKWLTKPQKGIGSIPSPKQIDDKAQKYINQIADIEQVVEEDDPETSKTITKLREKIQSMRKAGLKKGGEYSLENLVFKKLRNENYLTKLSDLRRQIYDREMSVDECPAE